MLMHGDTDTSESTPYLPQQTQVVREVTGAGYLCRHPAPNRCVAIIDTIKKATIAAWHPKVTAGPLLATHLTWKYTTQNPPEDTVY
jgi:hypothetical protein